MCDALGRARVGDEDHVQRHGASVSGAMWITAPSDMNAALSALNERPSSGESLPSHGSTSAGSSAQRAREVGPRARPRERDEVREGGVVAAIHEHQGVPIALRRR